jgi:hypothetical protein
MVCVPKVSVNVGLVPTKINVLGKVSVIVYVTVGLPPALSLKTSEFIDALAVKLTVPTPIVNEAMSVPVTGASPGHVEPMFQFAAMFQFPDPPFQMYVVASVKTGHNKARADNTFHDGIKNPKYFQKILQKQST